MANLDLGPHSHKQFLLSRLKIPLLQCPLPCGCEFLFWKAIASNSWYRCITSRDVEANTWGRSVRKSNNVNTSYSTLASNLVTSRLGKDRKAHRSRRLSQRMMVYRNSIYALHSNACESANQGKSLWRKSWIEALYDSPNWVRGLWSIAYPVFLIVAKQATDIGPSTRQIFNQVANGE